MSSAASDWTTVADIVALLQRRWASGRYLAAYASGAEWQPLLLPVRGQQAAELLERLDDVHSWLGRFNRDLKRFPGLRVESKIIHGRRLGSNEIPARLWVDSYAVLFEFLGVREEVARFDELARHTRDVVPELAE